MKGQMFVITMVFLVGLIFAVQSNLSQYSDIDLASSFEKNDLPMYTGIKQSFQHTLTASPTCAEAADNIRELESFLEGMIVDGASIEVSTSLDCEHWDGEAMNLTIHLKSIESDTRETLSLSR